MIVLNSENSNVLLDTYAWIEYFLGSKEGEIVKEYVEFGIISTSIISLAELSDKYYRENLSKEWNNRFKFIITKSKIINLTLDIVKEAGLSKLKLRKKDKTTGLADAIIYETAKQYELKILTGDLHFEDLDNIIFLK